MPRAAPIASWTVRALIHLLVVGLLALHLPLDALRAHAPAALVKALVKGCTSCCAPAATATATDEGCPPTLDAPDDPAPQDGCDPGCHCGCCGGVPIAAEVRPAPTLDATSEPSRALDRATAVHARRLDVFHPPRG